MEEEEAEGEWRKKRQGESGGRRGEWRMKKKSEGDERMEGRGARWSSGEGGTRKRQDKRARWRKTDKGNRID